LIAYNAGIKLEGKLIGPQVCDIDHHHADSELASGRHLLRRRVDEDNGLLGRDETRAEADKKKQRRR
jgi:hypothetical protein